MIRRQGGVTGRGGLTCKVVTGFKMANVVAFAPGVARSHTSGSLLRVVVAFGIRLAWQVVVMELFSDDGSSFSNSTSGTYKAGRTLAMIGYFFDQVRCQRHNKCHDFCIEL